MTGLRIPFEGDMTAVMLGSLVLAVLVTIIAAAGRRRRLGYRMGGPKWTFGESWASTFTVVGAFFVTVLDAGVLPEPPGEDATAAAQAAATTTAEETAAFAGLSLVFAVLVLIAPVVYSALGHRVVTDRRDKPPMVEYLGPVWGFLLASGIILWAVLGQLAGILLLMLPEMAAAGALPGMAEAVFRITLVAAILLTLFYGWKSMSWSIQDLSRKPIAPPTPAAPKEPDVLVKDISGTYAVADAEPMPRWPLM